MSRENVVRVRRIITNADMRQTKGLSRTRHAAFADMRKGDVVLLVNRACTIMRFVDSEGGVYTMWAPEGQRFDERLVCNTLRDQLVAINSQVVVRRGVQSCPEPGISTRRANNRRRRAA